MAIAFYLEYQPKELNRLLQVLTPNLDHSRVVHLLRKNESLSLAMPYLKAVQKEDLPTINEALNELYIEEEDYESLRCSIDDYKNFEQLVLAQKVEKHELLEFRRIAAYLFKKNKRYSESIELSKGDKMYKDAIDTAAESQNVDLVDSLLRYFVEDQKDKECFCACLYTCYSFVMPDVAMELAWRYQMTDFFMPYIIQYMRGLHNQIKVLEDRTAPKEEEIDGTSHVHDSIISMGDNSMLMLGNGPMPGYGMPLPPQSMGGMDVGVAGLSGVNGGVMPGIGMGGQMPMNHIGLGGPF